MKIYIVINNNGTIRGAYTTKEKAEETKKQKIGKMKWAAAAVVTGLKKSRLRNNPQSAH